MCLCQFGLSCAWFFIFHRVSQWFSSMFMMSIIRAWYIFKRWSFPFCPFYFCITDASGAYAVIIIYLENIREKKTRENAINERKFILWLKIFTKIVLIDIQHLTANQHRCSTFVGKLLWEDDSLFLRLQQQQLLMLLLQLFLWNLIIFIYDILFGCTFQTHYLFEME